VGTGRSSTGDTGTGDEATGDGSTGDGSTGDRGTGRDGQGSGNQGNSGAECGQPAESAVGTRPSPAAGRPAAETAVDATTKRTAGTQDRGHPPGG
jgi:hypothetical protein